MDYVLKLEGVSEQVRELYCRQFQNGKYGKSSNRSVIGTAVEYERMLKDHLSYASTKSYTKQEDLSRYLARTPLIGPKLWPHKAMKEALLERFGETGEFPREFD